jgi:NADH dehydrogenase
LLHQVATAALSPADVQPVQQCANRRCDIEILLDELVAVEIERSCLRMACGRRAKYDLLVLATGSPANFVECYDLMTIGSGAR